MKCALVLCIGFFLTTMCMAAAKKVQLKDLPPPVQKSVQDLIKGAELKSLLREEANGKTAYEVETIKNRKTRDARIDGSGTVLEIEEEATLDQIPEPARAAIRKAVANGKVRKMEIVTKGNSKTYEAAITKNGKSSEIIVNADGSPVK